MFCILIEIFIEIFVNYAIVSGLLWHLGNVIRQTLLVLSLALACSLGRGYGGNHPLVESRGHLVDVVEGEE